MTPSGAQAADPQGPEEVAVAFEGVLVAGHAIFAAIALATLAGYGHHPVGDPLAGLEAPSLAELARRLSVDLDRPALSEQIELRLERGLRAQLACDAHLLPGAVPLLRRLRPSFPLALTSGLPENLLGAALEAAGIAGFFSAVVGERADRPGPPHPAVHREAARRLEIPPGRMLAIEASEAGVLAAQASGMEVIGSAVATTAAARGPLDLDQLTRHTGPSARGGTRQTKTEIAGPAHGAWRGS